METVDIDFKNLEPLEPTSPVDSIRSFNMSGGMELLMNNKTKSQQQNRSANLGDIDDLERELNELSGNTPAPSAPTTPRGESVSTRSYFQPNSAAAAATTTPTASAPQSFIGSATVETASTKTKTWDGFAKMTTGFLKEPIKPLNDREKRTRKRMMIRKLEEWYDKRLLKHMPNFTEDTPYEEVEEEYESAQEEKRRKAAVHLQRDWFSNMIHTLEFCNARFDPFGINLDGWGEKVSEEIDSYDEVFSELYDKYKGIKTSPEISLLMRLGMSAATVAFTNSLISSAAPGFQEVAKQNPDLMRAFESAAVQSLNRANPAFSLMQDLAGSGGPDSVNTSFGPPPPPIDTKNPLPSQRPPVVVPNAPVYNGNRPDLMSRPLFESGVSIDGLKRVDEQDRSIRMPPSNFAPPRPDMVGPRMETILALKPPVDEPILDMNDSMMSATSLRDVPNGVLPKSTKKRNKPRSERNVVSLDL